MLSTKAACNALVRLAVRDGVELSPMKLQRILYIAAAEYGRETGHDMVAEPWEAWPYGPVNQNVFELFRSHGGAPITRLIPVADGSLFTVGDPTVLALLERVWEASRGVDGPTLSRVLRGDGSAWLKAFQTGETLLGREAVRTDASYQAVLGLERPDVLSNSPGIPDSSPHKKEKI